MRIKFYQNRLTFVEDMTKTFWCVFIGSQCILPYEGRWGPEITLLVKFKIWIKFGMPLHSDMLMMVRRSKLKAEVEFQYGSYGTDTTFHRTYF